MIRPRSWQQKLHCRQSVVIHYDPQDWMRLKLLIVPTTHQMKTHWWLMNDSMICCRKVPYRHFPFRRQTMSAKNFSDLHHRSIRANSYHLILLLTTDWMKISITTWTSSCIKSWSKYKHQLKAKRKDTHFGTEHGNNFGTVCDIW